MPGYPEDADQHPAETRGRAWSWGALIGAVVVWFAATLTWGLGVVLAPIPSAASAVAWFRSPHDAVFWVGASANVLLLTGLVSLFTS